MFYFIALMLGLALLPMEGKDIDNTEQTQYLREVIANLPPEAKCIVAGGAALVGLTAWGIGSIASYAFGSSHSTPMPHIQTAQLSAKLEGKNSAEIATAANVTVSAQQVHIHHLHVNTPTTVSSLTSTSMKSSMETASIPSRTELLTTNKTHSFWGNWFSTDTEAGWRSSVPTIQQTVLGGAACYVACNALLMSRLLYLKNPSRWLNWKAELSLQQLVEYPRNLLGEQLLSACASRYTNTGDVSHADTVERFLRDIAEEYTTLAKYRWWCDKIRTTGEIQQVIVDKISRAVWGHIPVINAFQSPVVTFIPNAQSCFYIDHNLSNNSQDFLMRLSYLRSLLLDYLATPRTKTRALAFS